MYGPQKVDNLLDAVIRNADGPDMPMRVAGKNTRRGAYSAIVEVVFRDLEERLASEIRQWDSVVGCCAWLTSEPILQALASIRGAQIIVQKEDFLRPDVGGHTKERLRRLYDQIPCENKWDHNLPYNVCSDEIIPAIMCAGICLPRNQIPPRMHHKFMVFGRHVPIPRPAGVEGEWDATQFRPSVVWTGSYNPTQNATRSLENAVIIRSDIIANDFYMEWRNVLGIAEQLDWRSEYVNPEYRIGT